MFFIFAFIQTLSGNTERNKVVGNILEPAIIARYVRIHPKTWQSHIALRFELYGCKEGESFMHVSRAIWFCLVSDFKARRDTMNHICSIPVIMQIQNKLNDLEITCACIA